MKKFFGFVLSLFLVLSGGIVVGIPTYSFAEDNDAVNLTISTPDEFVSTFKASTTYNNQNVNITLTADLDFSETDLSSIYQTKNTFCGTFDGNGWTISNINLSSEFLYYGLIPYAKDATIKNLSVTGDVKFTFKEDNIQEIFAGIIVGYGENTVIENCELNNVKVITEEMPQEPENSFINLAKNEEEKEPRIEQERTLIDIPVYSNINFGALAGKMIGNPRTGILAEGEANIVNCVSYYDINVNINKNSTLSVGGLVGTLEQAYILNCLSFGDITYSNSTAQTYSSSSEQYFGGAVGYMIGANSMIKNTCYGGNISSETDNSTLKVYEGAIVGGVSPSSKITVNNINFDYYTDDLNAIGYISSPITSDKIQQVNLISRNFLLNSENFDVASPEWNFDEIWMQVNSELHLQQFQSFDFSFNQVLDVTSVIDNATFVIGDEEYSESISVKYGTTIYLSVNFKNEYVGYYELSSVLLNSKILNLNLNYNQYVVQDEGGNVIGYKIPITVSDLTDGSYSFTVSAKLYDCVITVSDDAKLNKQGGVRSTDASSTTEEMPIPFTYGSAVRRIIAVGNGIYSFDYWELYYIQEDGSLQKVDFEEDTDSTVTIKFGVAPFNKEFKLVAYFTSEGAIKVGVANYNQSQIKSITIGGQLYDGENISVSPNNSRLTLEIVTNKNYILDYQSFMTNLQNTYGSSVIMMSSDPATDETTGETTYKFSMNMKVIQDLENNELPLSLTIVQDTSNNGSDLLWLYITIPAVVVVIAGVVTFILLKRRGGRGGKGGKAPKQEEKKSSYKDYYV